MTSRNRTALITLISTTLLAACAWSQAVDVHRFKGMVASSAYGTAIGGGEDVNGDGTPDIVVGARLEGAGVVRVYSGATGGVLLTLTNTGSSVDQFGRSVDLLGDVTGDGHADVLVGVSRTSEAGTFSGSARVFDGQSGALLYTVFGGAADDQLGNSVAGLDDVTGDGVPDFVVGTRFEDRPSPFLFNTGSAHVFDGATGTLVRSHYGDAGTGEFGRDLAYAGDVDGDGTGDYIVGQHRQGAGKVWVFSGATGGTLFTGVGDTSGDNFGWSVAGAGDVNADGHADFITSAFHDDDGGTSAGSARVFSGATGAALYTVHGTVAGQGLGRVVAIPGDVNGDGYADFAAASTDDDGGGTDAGLVNVYSGFDGTLLVALRGEAGDKLGVWLQAVGDVDGDRRPDLAMGAEAGDPPAAPADAGYVRVVGLPELAPRPGFAYQGGASADYFALSVSGGGDVNADGVPDFVIGAEREGAGGAARAYSGANGAVLFTWFGTGSNDAFGFRVAIVGDTNGDGFDDVAVGAPGLFSSTGYFRVFSGANGSLLFGDSNNNDLGRVGAVGDVNGDGFADVVAGGSSSPAYVYSGVDGSIILVLNGFLGAINRITGAGDVDADGTPDILVHYATAGMARVFSGVDGSDIHTFATSSTSADFNAAAPGDVDRDGYADVAVYDSPNVEIRSGADGLSLFTVPMQTAVIDLAPAGDYDGDGFRDLAISEMGQVLTIISGADGRTLARYTWLGGGSPASVLDGIGDLDGDGFDDLITGGANDAYASNRGSALILHSPGHALPGTADGLVLETGVNDVPSSRSDIRAAHPGDLLQVRLSAPYDVFGPYPFLLLAQSTGMGANVPGLGFGIHVNPLFSPVLVLLDGTATLPWGYAVLPPSGITLAGIATPALVGNEIRLQAISITSTAKNGILATSPALRVRLLP